MFPHTKYKEIQKYVGNPLFVEILWNDPASSCYLNTKYNPQIIEMAVK